MVRYINVYFTCFIHRGRAQYIKFHKCGEGVLNYCTYARQLAKKCEIATV